MIRNVCILQQYIDLRASHLLQSPMRKVLLPIFWAGLLHQTNMLNYENIVYFKSDPQPGIHVTVITFKNDLPIHSKEYSFKGQHNLLKLRVRLWPCKTGLGPPVILCY